MQVATALDIEERAEQLLQKNKDQVTEAQQLAADITKTKPTAAFLRLEEKDMRLFFSSIPSTPFPASSYVGAGYEVGFTPDALVTKLEAENPDRMNASISVELLPEIKAGYLFIVSISSDGSAEALQKTKMNSMKSSNSKYGKAYPLSKMVMSMSSMLRNGSLTAPLPNRSNVMKCSKFLGYLLHNSQYTSVSSTTNKRRFTGFSVDLLLFNISNGLIQFCFMKNHSTCLTAKCISCTPFSSCN